MRLQTLSTYSSFGHVPIVERLVEGFCAIKHAIHHIARQRVAHQVFGTLRGRRFRVAVVVAAARDEAEPAGLLEAAQRACGAELHAGARRLGLALMLAAILGPRVCL